METYDVIVVGAGPAGNTAAREAAENGMKTILIEEHPQIGIPEHCMGLIAEPKGTPLMQLIESIGERIVHKRLKSRKIFTPKGKMIEGDFGGAEVLVVERRLLDVAMANLAAAAGVKVVINTTVTGLITEGDAVKGVKTNSSTMPEVYGKIVIASDGIRSLLKGIPSWAKLTRSDQKVSSGMKWDIGGVEGLDDNYLEVHLGGFSERGFATIAPIGANRCLTDMVNLQELERIRKGNWVISTRFKNCTVLRMTAFSHPYPMGVMLPKRVKEGLMLAGDAGGFLGVDAAFNTGTAAGKVAAKAVKNGDITEQGLTEYSEISNEIGLYKFGYAPTFHNLDKFMGHSDEEIEEMYAEGKGIAL